MSERGRRPTSMSRRRRRASHAPADRRGGRSAERRQVDAGEPDRRPARRDRRRSSPGSRGTARSWSPSGPATTSASSTPAAGSRREESLAKQVSRQAERAIAAGRRRSSSWSTSPSAPPRRTRRSPGSCSASGKPVLLVANKVDDPNRENDVWAFVKLGLGDPYAVSAIHGRGSGDLLDALVAVLPPELPETVRRGRTSRSRSRSSAGRTSASRRCSTGWSATTARSCTTCPARPATRSTPSSRPTTDRCASSTPPGCGARARSRSRPSTTSVVRALNAVDQADAALLVIDADAGSHAPGPAARRAHRRRRHRGRDRAQQVGPRPDRGARAGRWPTSPTGSRFLGYAPVLKLSALTGKNVRHVLPALRAAEAAYHVAGPDRSAEPRDQAGPGAAPAAARRQAPAAHPLRDPGRDRPADVHAVHARARSRRRTCATSSARSARRSSSGPTPVKIRVRRRGE